MALSLSLKKYTFSYEKHCMLQVEYLDLSIYGHLDHRQVTMPTPSRANWMQEIRSHI